MPYFRFYIYFVVLFLSSIRLSNMPMKRTFWSVTLKPDGLRTPGEKTPQGLKDSSKQGHKLRILLYGPLLGVNTYAF